jgi:saccharopine dehydrogenase-like NADP-dependent oxidoreductase
MKRVLVLGAGLVSRPLVRYLLHHNFHVKIASRTVSKADRLIDGHLNGSTQAWLVDDAATLEKMIQDADLAISLLPAAYHVKVAELCIKHQKQMVTTSYVSPQMKALDGPAKAAGVMCLNEIGVDPGIDHMSAMRIIHGVEEKGGKVVSFMSYCGGLPAPDSNDNPLGYKFSWSPRAVLLAGRNDGKYLEDGKEVYIPGSELFSHHWPMTIGDLPELEAYTNRNCLPYIELYGLQGIKTMFRGTLRYPTWCDTVKKWVDLGLLSLDERNFKGMTYGDMIRQLAKGSPGSDLKQDLAGFWKTDVKDVAISKLEWLGVLSNAPLLFETGSPLDAMSHIMNEKMPYKPGERDMIILHHEFEAEYRSRKEAITSTLIDYGIPDGDSSMARTVSLPAAIGARLILDGKIKTTGVHIPVSPDIYNPVLDELARLDIECKEETHSM